MLKKDCENNCIHKTSIGGQAVIEGVMMRGPKDMAIAVRKSDGDIIVDKKPVKTVKYKFLKIPFIRGAVSFVTSMVTGVRSLMYSAEFVDIEEEGEPGKFEAWIEKVFGDKLKDAIIYFSVFISLIFSIGLFILLPAFLSGLVKKIYDNHTLIIVIEGVVRIGIFTSYILLVSRMKDIQRVFEYHGAEHKSIHCYEHGEELTVENVKKHTRLHPRCGTSFLFIVMIISIIVFFFVKADTWYLRLIFRILLLPVVAGISYEIIKIAGKYDNKLTRIISKPGMLMQYFTTREPDDSQIEVAIESLKAVLTGDKDEDKW